MQYALLRHTVLDALRGNRQAISASGALATLRSRERSSSRQRQLAAEALAEPDDPPRHLQAVHPIFGQIAGFVRSR